MRTKLINLAAFSACLYSGSAFAQSSEAPSPPSQSLATPTTQGAGAYYSVGKYLVTWGYFAIGLDTPKNAGFTGKGVTVAIFDSGVFTTNPHFAGRLLPGYNIYGNNGAGSVGVTSDNTGHGTFITGIIGADMSLTAGNTYGIATATKLLPIQVIDKNGNGTWTDAQLARGINHATNSGALISNNSWNSYYTLSELTSGQKTSFLNQNSQSITAWQQSAAKGVLTVFAAGNYSKTNPGIYATLPSMVSGLANSWVAVVSVDRDAQGQGGGTLSSFSNACGVAAAYCMAAPGNMIISTLGADKVGSGSGTSFAAPMVSGGAALLMEKYPFLKGPDIQKILFTTANKTGIYANTAIYGQGLLDLKKAFAPIGGLTIASTSSVNGAAAPITGSYVSGTGAFSVQVASAFGKINAIGLDEFKRDYQINLGNGVSTIRASNWGDQLALFGANETAENGVVTLQGNANGMKSSFVSVTSGGIGAAVGSNISPSFAYGPFAGGSVRGSDLVLLNSVGNPYMNMAPNSISAATSYAWDSQNTTRMGAFSNTVPRDELQLQHMDAPSMAGGVVEHQLRWDGGYLSANLGVVSESNSVLGSYSSGVLKLGSGATTAFAGINAGLSLTDTVQVFGGATIGYSSISAADNSMVTGIRGLTSGNAYAGVTKTQLFSDNDRFGFVVGVPMRINTGTANVYAPVSRDIDGNVMFDNSSVSLKSNTVEYSTQAFYSTELSNQQSLGFGVGARFNAPDVQNNSRELIGMARYKLRF